MSSQALCFPTGRTIFIFVRLSRRWGSFSSSALPSLANSFIFGDHSVYGMELHELSDIQCNIVSPARPPEFAVIA